MSDEQQNNKNEETTLSTILSDILDSYASLDEMSQHYHPNLVFLVGFLRDFIEAGKTDDGEYQVDVRITPSKWSGIVHIVCLEIEEGDRNAIIECVNQYLLDAPDQDTAFKEIVDSFRVDDHFVADVIDFEDGRRVVQVRSTGQVEESDATSDASKWRDEVVYEGDILLVEDLLEWYADHKEHWEFVNKLVNYLEESPIEGHGRLGVPHSLFATAVNYLSKYDDAEFEFPDPPDGIRQAHIDLVESLREQITELTKRLAKGEPDSELVEKTTITRENGENITAFKPVDMEPATPEQKETLGFRQEKFTLKEDDGLGQNEKRMNIDEVRPSNYEGPEPNGYGSGKNEPSNVKNSWDKELKEQYEQDPPPEADSEDVEFESSKRPSFSEASDEDIDSDVDESFEPVKQGNEDLSPPTPPLDPFESDSNPSEDSDSSDVGMDTPTHDSYSVDEGSGNGQPHLNRVSTSQTNSDPVAEIAPENLRTTIHLEKEDLIGMLQEFIDRGLLQVGLPNIRGVAGSQEGYEFNLNDIHILEDDEGGFELEFHGESIEEDDPNRAYVDTEALSDIWESSPDVTSVFGSEMSEDYDSNTQNFTNVNKMFLSKFK